MQHFLHTNKIIKHKMEADHFHKFQIPVANVIIFIDKGICFFETEIMKCLLLHYFLYNETSKCRIST